MKHCPNPTCPFLHQYKMVAEFRDEVEVCPDCGAQLVPGEAPDIELADDALPAAPYQPMFPENREPDLVTLCSVETEADAEFYKTKLEFQGIPVVIVPTGDEIEEAVAPENGDDEPEETVDLENGQVEDTELEDLEDADDGVLYEVQVLRSDLIRAIHFLDTLETTDTEAAAEDEQAEDGEDADEVEEGDEANGKSTAKPAWPDPADDKDVSRSAPPAPVTPGVTRQLQDEATEKTSNRSTQLLLIVVIAVVIILISLFLLNTFAK